jgi:hypothetical protein
MVLKLRIERLKLRIDVLKLRIEVLKLQIDVLKLRIQVLKLRIEVLQLRIRVSKLRIDDLKPRIGVLKRRIGVLKLQIDDLGGRSVNIKRYISTTYARMAGVGAYLWRRVDPIPAKWAPIDVPFRQTRADVDAHDATPLPDASDRVLDSRQLGQR